MPYVYRFFAPILLSMYDLKEKIYNTFSALFMFCYQLETHNVRCSCQSSCDKNNVRKTFGFVFRSFSFWRHDLSRLASVPLLRRSTQIMREHLSMNRSLPAMLGHQQTGRISGDHFRDRLVTTRCSDLNLSEFQDCHVVPHSSAINAIHVDNCDYRYLLAGASTKHFLLISPFIFTLTLSRFFTLRRRNPLHP